MELKKEFHAYDEKYKLDCKTGWGCGYVIIPKEHPILVKERINSSSYDFYIQPEGFDQEISYCRKVVGEDKKFTGEWKIGFDTAHRYNNATHDKEWVEKKTEELKVCVESYTKEHARQEAQEYIEKIKSQLKQYL